MVGLRAFGIFAGLVLSQLRSTEPLFTKVCMKQLIRPVLFLGLSSLFTAGLAQAADPVDPKLEQVRSSLAVFLPNLQIDHIAPSAIPGLYEVTFDSRLMYVSENGRFILQGSIFDLEAQRDLTKPRLGEIRAQAMEALGEDNMLIYEPAEARYQITVFTDIDCPYCRKMHNEMAGYLERGIRFRYLFYPRAGKDSPSYNKAVSVWCADDRRAALDRIKGGAKLPERSCDNPVDKHMTLADKMPIRGTPAIVLNSGEVLPGYLPPERLLQVLQDREKNQ